MSKKPDAGRDESGQVRSDLACLREAEASLRRSQAVSDDAASDWFVGEVLPLEPILVTYLRQNWANSSEISDLRQEVYARVFEAARERIPDNPKRFLLTAARNLLIDRVRREHVVPMESYADFDALGIAADEPAPDRQLIQRENIRNLEAAFAQLPPRTREAITLAYFEGLSAGEIARRMGIAQPVASKLIARGTLILGRILRIAPAGRAGSP